MLDCGVVRVIAKRTLHEFWTIHRDAEQPLKAWYREAREAEWTTPHDVTGTYRRARIIANNRVVFNVAGNKYRLVAGINYGLGIVYVRFIGTHAEYDRIDTRTV